MSPRARILAPSIRSFGPTQDRRWISKKPRASLASFMVAGRYTALRGHSAGYVKLSSAGEFHSHALPKPDVNLSIHPAPIVQPLTPAPNAQTVQAVGRGPATTSAMLAACARGAFCISVAPFAPGNHPACAMRLGAPKREIARSSEPIPSQWAGSNGQPLPKPDRCDDATASDAFSVASLWPLSRLPQVRN